jgi:hypothetical protein
MGPGFVGSEAGPSVTWSDVPNIVIAIVAIYGAWIGRQNSRHIQEVHLSINSRMDQLLKSSNDAAHAAGADQERNRELH